jgi:hypothetical protein
VAIQGFAAAAQKGNRLAQFNYAMMLLRGEGTPAKPQEALIWLRRAADNQMTHAQFTFGDLYERGELVPKSLEEANRWYERAAQGGHVQAQMALATNYFTGRGVPLDYGRAFGWYSKAAAPATGPRSTSSAATTSAAIRAWWTRTSSRPRSGTRARPRMATPARWPSCGRCWKTTCAQRARCEASRAGRPWAVQVLLSQ